MGPIFDIDLPYPESKWKPKASLKNRWKYRPSLIERSMRERRLRTENIARLMDENCVKYSDFYLPVKDKKTGEKVVDLLNNYIASRYAPIRKEYEEILIGYFSQNKNIKKVKTSILLKEGLFNIIALLNNGYVLANKVTPKLYKLKPYTFEKIVRYAIENPYPIPKQEQQEKSYSKNYVWDQPITINYNPRKGFQTENPGDMKKFSFLEEMLNDFLNKNKEVFDKLKKDVDLTYSLEVHPNKRGFYCSLDEKSIVKKACGLSGELEQLVDKPKELASKIDEFEEISQEILSKCGIENIDEVEPLLRHGKDIREFKFTGEDFQAYFFANCEHTVKRGTRHVSEIVHPCIFFSKDTQPIPENPNKVPKIKYFGVDEHSAEATLDFLFKKNLIVFKFGTLWGELKSIEKEIFDQLDKKPQNDLERILKIKEIELPPRWFAIRDYIKDGDFKSGDLTFFAYSREYSLIEEMINRLKIPKRGGSG